MSSVKICTPEQPSSQKTVLLLPPRSKHRVQRLVSKQTQPQRINDDNDNHKLNDNTATNNNNHKNIDNNAVNKIAALKQRCDKTNPTPNQRHKLSTQKALQQPLPWFGIDIGSFLVKIVFFDPTNASSKEERVLCKLRHYLTSAQVYGATGRRDTCLELHNCIVNGRLGTLHFIRFSANQLSDFINAIKSTGLTRLIKNVFATGGGSYKFETNVASRLAIRLHKSDEFDSVISGIHYIEKYNSLNECYYLIDPLSTDKCLIKVPYDFRHPFPYLVVNIGSGISILAVYSSNNYVRLTGSNIGGGTFLGLCALLCQCNSFEEAIEMAQKGSSCGIDKLVKDIYGGDYAKFNLSGDLVASSFGNMNLPERRDQVSREDIARAILEMVTLNTGSIGRICAINEKIDRVVFTGNFLRKNDLSMRLLSYAVDYWSKGAIRALFLEHEGYFGAVGCFVESLQEQLEDC